MLSLSAFADQEYLSKLVDLHLLGGHKRKILDAARPAVLLLPEDDHPDATGLQFGGSPSLPESMAWPHIPNSDTPLQFVARLDCVVLSDFDNSELLPKSGHLFFFIRLRENDAVLPCQVFHTTEALLDDPGQIPTGATPWMEIYFNAQRGVSLPQFGSDRFRDLEIHGGQEIAELDDEYRYMALCEILKPREEISQLLGYPADMHGNAARHAAMGALGLDEGDYFEQLDRLRHHFREDPQALEAYLQTFVPLLQVDSHAENSFLWGESGKLLFMIPYEDLARQDFSNVQATILSP